MTEQKVLEALGNVQEPDLGKDLVTLNMVKDIRINGKHVSFTVVLTTPACPLKDHIKNACINAVKILVDKTGIILSIINYMFRNARTSYILISW